MTLLRMPEGTDPPLVRARVLRAWVAENPSRAFWPLLAIVLSVFVLYEHRLGFTYPAPWPDESLFLWQALGFRDHGTPFAPELNETRPMFWMPYGYMALSGLIFKLTGFSLSWARTLSALYVSGAVASLAVIARSFRARFGLLVLFAAFLSSPICRLVGNTARMESLVVFTGCAGLALMHRGRIAAGLAVIALAPLVHPNGQFIVLAGLLYLAVRVCENGLLRVYFRRRRVVIVASAEARAFRFPIERWELAVVGAALVCWALFLAYFVQHWEPFVKDLAIQLDWKRYEVGPTDNWTSRLLSPGIGLPMLLLSAALLPLLRYAPHAAPFAALAAPLLLRAVLTVGWTYEYYSAVAYLCVAVVLVEFAVSALGLGFRLERWAGSLATASFAVLVGTALFLVSRHSVALTQSVTVGTVDAPTPAPDYWGEADRVAVRAFLRSLEQKADRTLRVYFVPAPDGLLFEELRSKKLLFVNPTTTDPRKADVFVLHWSPWHTQVVRSMAYMSVFERGAAASIEQWPVIHAGKGSRWAVYQRPRSATVQR